MYLLKYRNQCSKLILIKNRMPFLTYTVLKTRHGSTDTIEWCMLQHHLQKVGVRLCVFTKERVGIIPTHQHLHVIFSFTFALHLVWNDYSFLEEKHWRSFLTFCRLVSFQPYRSNHHLAGSSQGLAPDESGCPCQLGASPATEPHDPNQWWVFHLFAFFVWFS